MSAAVAARAPSAPAYGPGSDRAPVAVLGAGLAGLVAAQTLRRAGVPVAVYEAGPRIAGLARSFVDADGFTYDFGAHFITNRLAAAVGVGAECRDVLHYAETVWLDGRSRGYPHGLATVPRFAASAVAARLRPGAAPESAAEWFRREYGPRLAEEVAIPLVEAWSGAPADTLAPSVGQKLDGGVRHVLGLKAAARLTGRAVAHGYCREQPEHAHVWHVYPERGVETLCDALARGLSDAIHLDSPVERVLVEGGRVAGVRVGGRDLPARAVVSTAPLHVLARIVDGTDALRPLGRFRYRPMVFVNMRFEGRGLLPDVVTWVPDRALPFFRLTEAPLSMPWLAPPGRTLVTADIGCEVGDELWRMDDDALGAMCAAHLEAIAPAARGAYRGCRVLRTPLAYPVYLREYEADRRRLEAEGLPVEGLHTIGRNGEFAHILMEDVYWRTRRRMRALADALTGGRAAPG